MTCIVGIQHEGKVYIGGDSAGVSGYAVSTRGDSKVFQNKEMIFGFTTSFRMGQLLRYRLDIPECTTWDIEKYMCTDFIDAVRKCFKEGGFAQEDNPSGGTFLVGFKGRLWLVDSDFQVGWNTCGYDSVGCGFPYALGALSGLSMLTNIDNLSPENKITIALQAAAMLSGGVTGPFNIVSI